MDTEDLSVERLEQQHRAPLLPSTLLDLPVTPSTVLPALWHIWIL